VAATCWNPSGVTASAGSVDVAAMVDVVDVVALVGGDVTADVAGVVPEVVVVGEVLAGTDVMLAGALVTDDCSSPAQAAARHSNVAASTDLIARTVVRHRIEVGADGCLSARRVGRSGRIETTGVGCLLSGDPGRHSEQALGKGAVVAWGARHQHRRPEQRRAGVGGDHAVAAVIGAVRTA